MLVRRAPQCFKAQGVTMVELLLAVGIAGILLTVALPSFRGLLDRQRVQGLARDLHAGLTLARSEAIARGLPVVLAPNAGDWNSGWRIFVDADGDGSLGAGETLVRKADSLPDAIQLTGADAAVVTFLPSGRVRQAGALTFTLDGKTQRKVIVNLLGRPRVCDPVADAENC